MILVVLSTHAELASATARGRSCWETGELSSGLMIPRPWVGTPCGPTCCVLAMNMVLYSNLLHLTQVYKWEGNRFIERRTGDLLKATFTLISLAQSPVKMRWALLDALKSIPTQFTIFLDMEDDNFCITFNNNQWLANQVSNLPAHAYDKCKGHYSATPISQEGNTILQVTPHMKTYRCQVIDILVLISRLFLVRLMLG